MYLYDRKSQIPAPHAATDSPAVRSAGLPNFALQELLAGKSTAPTDRLSALEDKLLSRLPRAAASRPVDLPPDLRRKAEDRFHVPLDGLQIRQDTGLQQSGFNGFAQGNVIHVDQNLNHQKREQVTFHEIAHVIQRGAGLANGSGLLEDPALEAQADHPFHAPPSFSMPQSAAGPVLGDRTSRGRPQLPFPFRYQNDLARFQHWEREIEELKQLRENSQDLDRDQRRRLLELESNPRKKNLRDAVRFERRFTPGTRDFESVSNDQVGSIYFSLRPSGYAGAGRPMVPGGRLRLIHESGPAAEWFNDVRRYARRNQSLREDPDVFYPNRNQYSGSPAEELTRYNCGAINEEIQRKNQAAGSDVQYHVYERLLLESGSYATHPSRGMAEQTDAVGNLHPEDYQKLTRAVLFSKRLMQDEWSRFRSQFLKDDPWFEASLPAERPENVEWFHNQTIQAEWDRESSHGNHFLYTFMKDSANAGLNGIPLNEEDFQRRQSYTAPVQPAPAAGRSVSVPPVGRRTPAAAASHSPPTGFRGVSPAPQAFSTGYNPYVMAPAAFATHQQRLAYLQRLACQQGVPMSNVSSSGTLQPQQLPPMSAGPTSLPDPQSAALPPLQTQTPPSLPPDSVPVDAQPPLVTPAPSPEPVILPVLNQSPQSSPQPKPEPKSQPSKKTIGLPALHPQPKGKSALNPIHKRSSNPAQPPMSIYGQFARAFESSPYRSNPRVNPKAGQKKKPGRKP